MGDSDVEPGLGAGDAEPVVGAGDAELGLVVGCADVEPPPPLSLTATGVSSLGDPCG